jgi:hypothetical protein
MTYQEEEQVRLKRLSSKHAIALAMQARWREAVVANKGLIESFPSDVDAHNRLGKAYMELGEYSLAREAYSRTLGLDPYNTIAKKNLLRLSHLGEVAAGVENESRKAEPHIFIEEVGKAGVVNLFNLAPPERLAKTMAGDKVQLKIDGTSLIVKNASGEYLGEVEPKHGQRLVKLMEGGNQYEAAITSSTAGVVTVIIREVYQHPSQAGQPSFPAKGAEIQRPYVGERMIRRELEYEEALPEEPGYTIIAGDEAELLPGELPGIGEKDYGEEED